MTSLIKLAILSSRVMTLMSLMLLILICQRKTTVRMVMTRSTASSGSYRKMTSMMRRATMAKASMKNKKEMGQKCLIKKNDNVLYTKTMQVITVLAIRRRIQIRIL